MDRSLRYRAAAAGLCLAAPLLLLACGGGGDDDPPVNEQPGFVAGSVSETRYDGTSDDLLTAGLGTAGIGGAAPAYADPVNPTPAELRRNAIYNNYRALIDFSAAGGYGTLFGPNVDNAGNATLGEGKVAGTEHIAYADDGSGAQNVTLMVQVPDSFDTDNACIVTATSSGSRGIYGAIGTAGDWGLKQGCAVAYTDKGTGNGFHDLQADRVTLRDGRVVTADAAGEAALFRAELNDGERAAFNAAFPDRVAYKHAHSQQNPEKDWGLNTLQSIELAFYVLNQKFGEPLDEDDEDDERRRVRLDTDNTLVIASSVSNGGGAALAAAEQDDEGLIDGVAVSEPNAQPRSTDGLTIEQGTATVQTIGRPLIDYFTHANLYQPCAALSADAGLHRGGREPLRGAQDPRLAERQHARRSGRRGAGQADRVRLAGREQLPAAVALPAGHERHRDGARKAQSDRVLEGVNEVLLSADLQGLPTLIVAGRNDTLLPVNHAARAYFGSNQLEEGTDSRVRYYEVTNAQHFDTFIAFGPLLGYDTRFVPLHGYFVQAMNLMYAHLRDGTALPTSQVVRTTPRGAGQPLTASNVPPISATPAAADRIAFDDGTLTVPD